MTTPRGLLDTSVVIALGSFPGAGLPDLCLISTVTLAELSVGPLATSDPREQAVRLARLQQAEHDFDPLPFDPACARAFGQVAADLRAAGRKSRARTFDAMIAATAVANDLPLFTLNPDDFAYITCLDLRSLSQ